MAGVGGPEVGDLAFHPDVGVLALERGPRRADQVADAPHPARGGNLERKPELIAHAHEGSLTD